MKNGENKLLEEGRRFDTRYIYKPKYEYKIYISLVWLLIEICPRKITI